MPMQMLVDYVNQPQSLSKDNTLHMLTNINIVTIPARIAGIVGKYAKGESSTLRRKRQAEQCFI
jgi:hypothetical protein